MVDEQRIAEIRARVERAAPGPWTAEDGQLLDQHDLDPVLSCCNIDEQTLAFIAHAREDIPYLLDALAAANSRAERAEQERDRLRDSLVDMVTQFAYQGQRDGLPAYSTGGLSALEHAFDCLEWEDPYPVVERRCQADGCREWASCGTPTTEGYKFVCGEHFDALAATAPAQPAGEGEDTRADE